MPKAHRGTIGPGGEKPLRDPYDWLMFAVGLAGVAAVVATIWISRGDQASNAHDVQTAITKMAAIAKAMGDEKPLLEKQAKAAADSAEAAKVTAHLVKGQTDATIIQASALIRSARATVEATSAQLSAAQAQLASAQANTRAAEAGAQAAELQRQSAILFSNSRAPVAKLASVELAGFTDKPGTDGMVKVKVKPLFSNVGGGTLLADTSTFNLVLASNIPTSRPATNQNAFGGNENPVSPGIQYSPVKGFEYNLPKSDIDSVSAGKKAIIVWGELQFQDNSGKRYRSCYIDAVQPPTTVEPGGAVRALAIAPYECGNP